MLYYCLKFRRNFESIIPKAVKKKNGRIMLSSNCAVCGYKKSRFIKNQEANGLLKSLKIRTF